MSILHGLLLYAYKIQRKAVHLKLWPHRVLLMMGEGLPLLENDIHQQEMKFLRTGLCVQLTINWKSILTGAALVIRMRTSRMVQCRGITFDHILC